jgi:IS30 family transposase
MASRINLLEREMLFKLLDKKIPIAQIAKIISRHRSAIYKEINRVLGAYSPSIAQNDAILKSQNSKKKEKFQNKDLNKYVEDKLKLLWSPEQISNRLKIDFPDDTNMRVSTETIYKFIYNIKNPYEKRQLIKCLRQRKKYRYSRKNKNEKRGKIPNMKSIHERPLNIENRDDIGHWEGDTVVGKDHKSAIGTLVERKLRLTIIVPLKKGKNAHATAQAFIDKFNQIPPELRKSLTFDRGTEMTYHEKITAETGVIVYFADPHSPWQRGLNENTNGLIRTYFPKKTDFSIYSEEDYKKVENALNNRPRKVLNYLTPNELTFANLNHLAI